MKIKRLHYPIIMIVLFGTYSIYSKSLIPYAVTLCFCVGYYFGYFYSIGDMKDE